MMEWCVFLDDRDSFWFARHRSGLLVMSLRAWRLADGPAAAVYVAECQERLHARQERNTRLQEQFMAASGLATSNPAARMAVIIKETTNGNTEQSRSRSDR